MQHCVFIYLDVSDYLKMLDLFCCSFSALFSAVFACHYHEIIVTITFVMTLPEFMFSFLSIPKKFDLPI